MTIENNRINNNIAVIEFHIERSLVIFDLLMSMDLIDESIREKTIKDFNRLYDDVIKLNVKKDIIDRFNYVKNKYNI